MSEMKSLTLNDKKYDGFVDPVARELAAASGVIISASGENISISDSNGGKLFGLNIYGKTTQAGTPTPDAPIDLVSVGDSGSITVAITGENDGQSMVIVTPNGLPGIPVSTGGNYTDANGKQWICDEIDFARGVYVQRIDRFSFPVSGLNNNSDDYAGWTNSGIGKYYPNAGGSLGVYGVSVMCNIDSNPGKNIHINTTSTGDLLMIPNPTKMKQSEWKTKYPDLVFEMIASIPTPIEIPLSEEEIAAYKALHTYRGLTTVSNDASAYMELDYGMDTKKYIDSMIAGTVINATVE